MNTRIDSTNSSGARTDAASRQAPVPRLHESAPALRLLVVDAWRRLRGGVLLALGLSVVNGLLEGIGVLLMLPLLNTIGIGGEEASIPLFGDIDRQLTAFGIAPSTVTILLLIVGVFTVQYLVFLAYSHVTATLQTRYEALWRRDLLSSCLSSGWAFFTRHKGGELINTLIGETTRAGGALQLLIQVTSAFLVIAVYVGLAAATSWQTTLYLLLVGSLLFLSTRWIVKRGRRLGTEISRETHQLQSHANELVGGAKLIKATATEQVTARRFAPSSGPCGGSITGATSS